MDAATADVVRSARYAHHQRDWELQRGNPFSRLLRRWHLARRLSSARRVTVRRDQAVTPDAEVQPS